jgi:glycosyltransferase involved in cell wall biosynthesis
MELNKNNSNFGVNLFGYLTGEFGIGEATRSNAKAIKKVSIPIKLINFNVKTNHRHNDKTFTNFDKESEYFINLIQLSADKDQLNQFFNHFDFENFKNKYNILYFAWESETLPERFLKYIYCFDEIWTPSQYCKSCFEKHINLPITVIPHPVEIQEDFSNIEKENIFDKQNFNFFFMFDYNSSIVRKNVIELIKVFKIAFEGWENNAFLTIKSSKSDRNKNEKIKILEEIGDSKKIKLIENIYEKNTLNYIISTCDCFVSMHLSEGFGLTMAEAMYFGKIVIATGYSGNLEFMNKDNSILLNYIKNNSSDNSSTFYKEIIWSKPDSDDAVNKLKMVYENQFLEIKNNAYHSIRNKLSYENIGNLIKKRIEEILNFSNNKPPTSSNIIQLLIENNSLNKELKFYKKFFPLKFIYKLIKKNKN